jgi:DNA mismatch repair protein MSH5
MRLHSRPHIADSHNGTPLESGNDGRPLPAGADDDVDALNEVILAVNLRERGTVGCAYYVARDEKLYFMEDSRLGGVETIEARKCL